MIYLSGLIESNGVKGPDFRFRTAPSPRWRPSTKLRLNDVEPRNREEKRVLPGDAVSKITFARSH